VTVAAVAAMLLTTAGCQWPRDPEGTLEQVRGQVIRVGVTESSPWTVVNDDDSVQGVEAALVEQLAERLGADVEWHPGSEADILAALEVRALDLAIGGFTSKSPYASQVSMTRPYLTTKAFVAVPQGQDPPGDIAGVRVSVEAGSEEAGLLEKTDAVPVPVPDLSSPGDSIDGPAVLHEWLLDDFGFTRTDVQISVTEHVLAVPLGENGWLTTVEDFLLNLSAEELDALLDQAVRAEAGG
jgi:polar amino acid transport system substrate-binding protein